LAGDKPLTPQLEIKRKLTAGIDRIAEEVQSRSVRLQVIDSRFGILLLTKHLFSQDEDEVNANCKDMAQNRKNNK